MKQHYSPILASIMVFVMPMVALAQPDLMSRVATYDGSGLQSWSAEAVYADITTASNQSLPQKNMVFHNGTYYHVFTADDGGSDIFLRTSADGLNWTAPIQVNDDVPGDSAQVRSNLVVFGDDIGGTTVVVSWMDGRAASWQLRTATSTDGGATFAASVPVSAHTDAMEVRGNLAVDGAGRLYTAWSRFDGGCWGSAWFSTSDDAGDTWSPMAQIYSGQCYSDNPHVLAGGPDSVMVVVSDDQFNHKNMIVMRSIDGGAVFTQASISNYTLTQSITQYSSSAVDPSGRVHVAFTYGETLGTASSINYSTSTDWGYTWTVPVAVSDQPLFPVWNYHGGQVPAIASAPSSDAIYIAWSDPHAATGNFDVYVTRSTDGGLTWDADQTVNVLTTPLDQYSVSIALEDLGGGNANVAVTWNDDRFALAIPDPAAGSRPLVYPVPASDHLHVDLSWAAGPLRYEVIDARGGIMAQGAWNGGAVEGLDVSRSEVGLYLLRLAAADRVLAVPWVKE